MLCFVINKKSGNGKAGKVWSSLQSELAQLNIAYTTIFSVDAADARVQLRTVIQQAVDEMGLQSAVGSEAGSSSSAPDFRVIVVGGDGTVHSILPVLIESKVTVGLIPAGSGNDMARSLHLPFEPIAALHYALNGHVLSLDCIYAYGEYSLNVVGIGLDALVAHTVNGSRWKKWLNRIRVGFLAYVFSLLFVLMTYRPAHVRVWVDGEPYEFQKVWLMATANLPYFGGGMRISPQSQGNDGQLEVCVVHGLSRLGLLLAFPKVYRGTHLSHPNVAMLQGTHVRATSSESLLAQGDGEGLGKTPVQLEIHAQCVSVIGRLS